MAKIYHNGEYVSNGGGGGVSNVASIIPTFFVEMNTIPTSENPIQIDMRDYYPTAWFNLVVLNNTSTIVEVDRLYVRVRTQEHSYYNQTFAILTIPPIYKDLYPYQTSEVSQFYSNTPSGKTMINRLRMQPHRQYAFRFFDNGLLVSEETYYTNHLRGRSSGTAIRLYVDRDIISDNPVSFMISGATGGSYSGNDMGADTTAQLTMGTIRFSSLGHIGIKQETIYGGTKLKDIKFYTIEGGTISPLTDENRWLNPPLVMEFNLTTPSSSLAGRWALDLFL